MSELVGSVTRKKSSDFHGGIRFQSSFTIRWELEDKTFLKIDIICLDDSLNYRMPFSNSATYRKPRRMDLVTASELIPGFCRSKSNVPTPGSLRTIKSPTGGIVSGIKSPPLARTPPPPPHGIYIDRCIIPAFVISWPDVVTFYAQKLIFSENCLGTLRNPFNSPWEFCGKTLLKLVKVFSSHCVHGY